MTMRNPEQYEKHNMGQRRQCESLLNEIVPHLSWGSANQKILDVGCATGDFTAQLIPPKIPADRSWQIIGFDISPEMVEHARKHYSQPNIKYILGDIADPNIEACSVWQEAPFQKIFSFFCLNLVTEQRLAVQNIYKLLDDEGETVLMFVPRGILRKLTESVINHPKWNAYLKDYPFPQTEELFDSKDEITALLESVGFQIHCCRHEVYTRKIDSLEQVLDYVTHINYYEKYIPEERREEFILDYFTIFNELNLLKEAPQTEDSSGYEIYTTKFIVHASKNRKLLNIK